MDMQDKIIDSLVEMKGQMGSLVVSVKDLQDSQQRVMQMLDNQAVILKRLDQERFFTSEHIRRIEADVEMLKKHLHLA